jgi:hypothetical protein
LPFLIFLPDDVAEVVFWWAFSVDLLGLTESGPANATPVLVFFLPDAGAAGVAGGALNQIKPHVSWDVLLE